MMTEPRRVDLHMHSTASDGSLTPSELVAHAKEAGLSAIALTDHDTTGGIAEAMEAAHRLDIELVAGIEISAKRDRGTLHIVGLFIDPSDETLQRRCKELRAERDSRNDKIVARLNELGLAITLDEVRAKSGGGVIGRPHFASVMIEKGYVADNSEAFDKWLAKGKPAYFPKALFDPSESIQMIHDAGGVAIAAHPSQLRCADEVDLDATIGDLVSLGLDAIETQWTFASDEDRAMAERVAERHGLLRSGGSDFHGAVKPQVEIGKGIGDVNVGMDILDALRQRARERR